jgi:hypothetical protein
LVARKSPNFVAAQKMGKTKHVYKICLHKNKRGFDLISDVLPFGRGCLGGLIHEKSCLVLAARSGVEAVRATVRGSRRDARASPSEQ